MSEQARGSRVDVAVDYFGRLAVFGLVAFLMAASYETFPEAGLAWAPLMLWLLGLVADGAIARLTGMRGMRLARSVGATVLVWILLGMTFGVVTILGNVITPVAYSFASIAIPLTMILISFLASSLLPPVQATMTWAIVGIGSAMALNSTVVMSNDSGFLQVALAYVLCLGSSGAFILYLRRALAARLGWRALVTRLAWAAAAMAFSITIALISLNAVTTALMETQAQQESDSRLSYLHGVAYDLGSRFPDSSFASASPELIAEITRAAAVNDVGLTLWDLQVDRPLIAIRSGLASDDSNAELTEVHGYSSVKLSTAERRVIARAAEAARSGGGSTDAPMSGPVSVPVAAALRAQASDPASVSASGATYRIAVSQPSKAARFVLVSSLSSPDWQRWPGFTAQDVWLGVSSSMFPWLFLAFLLPCSLALLALDRRDAVRATLIATEERARLNRDAHDRVYNRLTALANQLAATKSPDAAPPTPAEQIRRTVDDLQAILGDGITAPYLTASSAAASLLADVCEDQGRLWSMEVTLEGAEVLEGVDPRTGWELQCIAEEALTNAGKHGHAEHVRVGLTAEDGLLRLEVADDGCGIAGPLGTDGLPVNASGMQGMLQRARALGGSLAVTTGADGTTVSATIPHVSGS